MAQSKFSPQKLQLHNDNTATELCSINKTFSKTGDPETESKKTSLPHTYESLKGGSWLDSPKGSCFDTISEEKDSVLRCKGSNIDYGNESHAYAVLEVNPDTSSNGPRQSQAKRQESPNDSSWYDKLQPKPKPLGSNEPK